MQQRILVLFEQELVSQAALRSARELALRLGASVTLLMLIAMSFGDRLLLSSKRRTIRQVEERVGQRLDQLKGLYLADGIQVDTDWRLGDPAEELLKFLAERPPFQALIWGSHSGSGDRLPAPRHWLGRLSATFECPVLKVTAKGDLEQL